ncbi:MAG: hypothetical protein EBR82_73850, partial [Caulobacteraceae bacterium]|nr:hypothetical protein [Caulobacteraceae bacterium]
AEKGKELPIGGKATKMGEPSWTGEKGRKDAAAAYDVLQNAREQEAEIAEEDYDRDMERQLGYKPTPVKYKKGGSVRSASKRADGCAQRGKTRGKMV